MKPNTASLILIALLGAVGATSVLAHVDYAYSDSSATHWLEHAAQTKGQPSQNALAPFGYAANVTADRIVNIDGGTKYLNVTRLETVQLNAGGKSVIWTFDTFGTRPFPLSNVIPGYEGITVYVAESQNYSGG